MNRKFLAFDLETAKILPNFVENLLDHRPLGITCAATLAEGEEPTFWHSSTSQKKPAKSMTREDATSLVRHLEERVTEGYTIVTWNGLAFDFDVLAEESGLADECRILARNHIDLMFHVFCDRGYPIGLDSAAKGMSLQGKSKGVEQHLVPQMWIDEKHDEVLNYLGQDVAITLNLAKACEQRQELRWITRRGTPSAMPLKQGWLRVDQAVTLPLPDTSWMDKPMTRSKFTSWLELRK
jgi:hypothetical protein